MADPVTQAVQHLLWCRVYRSSDTFRNSNGGKCKPLRQDPVGLNEIDKAASDDGYLSVDYHRYIRTKFSKNGGSADVGDYKNHFDYLQNPPDNWLLRTYEFLSPAENDNFIPLVDLCELLAYRHNHAVYPGMEHTYPNENRPKTNAQFLGQTVSPKDCMKAFFNFKPASMTLRDRFDLDEKNSKGYPLKSGSATVDWNRWAGTHHGHAWGLPGLYEFIKTKSDRIKNLKDTNSVSKNTIKDRLKKSNVFKEPVLGTIYVDKAKWKDMKDITDDKEYKFQRVRWPYRDAGIEGWNMSSDNVDYLWGYDPKEEDNPKVTRAAHLGIPFHKNECAFIIWITHHEAFLEGIRLGDNKIKSLRVLERWKKHPNTSSLMIDPYAAYYDFDDLEKNFTKGDFQPQEGRPKTSTGISLLAQWVVS